MATITDVFVSTNSRTVLTKPPDSVRQFSPWPRAIVNATVFNGAVSAKPVNDLLEMQIRVDLDPKFAYRFFDFDINLIQDTAFDWETNAFIEVVDGVRSVAAGNARRHRVQLLEITDSVATGQMWVSNGAAFTGPRYIIQATEGNAIFFNFFAVNLNVAVGAAGSLNSLFRFWEYEIEQAEWFALHYAQMVYAGY